MTDKKKQLIENNKALEHLLDNVAESIHGGEDVSLASEIEPMPVTDETEKAFKDAQRKKAEEEDSHSSDYYSSS